MAATSSRRTWLLVGGLAAGFALSVLTSAAVFGVEYDYTLVTVALGGAVLGVVSGVLGTFAVLRQESLMGDALSHAALPGVAVAFLIAGRDLGLLLIGAGIASWVAVMFIRAVRSTTRIKEDAAMGMTLAAFFALGIALLTYIQRLPDARQAGLTTFVLGQAAAIVQRDVIVTGAVGLAAFACLALFWKELKLIAFDREFAQANGFPLRRLEVLLATLIVVAIVLGLQIAGVVFMVGMLIAPAVAARQWTHSLGQMVVLSAAFGAVAGASGAIISGIARGLPTGPIIIVVAFVMVLISMGFAPERGLLWAALRRRDDRRRFTAQTVMRDLYQHALRHHDPHHPTPERALVMLRGAAARAGLKQLEAQGIARHEGQRGNGGEDCWSLTDAGVARAQQDAHNQLLWELYRRHGEGLNLPAIHEDRQQDITRLLPPEAFARLEALRTEGEG